LCARRPQRAFGETIRTAPPRLATHATIVSLDADWFAATAKPVMPRTSATVTPTLA
jgi:hypothetical protein